MWDDIISNVIGVVVGALGTLIGIGIKKIYTAYKDVKKLKED